ncbi:hypothetical protein OGAPHI_005560 [Ogataea philodendri]|uniref:Uncharacterized protein n=1 Tax=Ogataea philodendri TaxID=1378263 RepID=A0A9P8P0A2_9ASCO|nr:uncharacterized protein OGAPHI_005560 [Ogataea philodendri]KAH3662309.1 hypothetical protein OGAPHI_005560 [Ogataea philodendri]
MSLRFFTISSNLATESPLSARNRAEDGPSIVDMVFLSMNCQLAFNAVMLESPTSSGSTSRLTFGSHSRVSSRLASKFAIGSNRVFGCDNANLNSLLPSFSCSAISSGISSNSPFRILEEILPSEASLSQCDTKEV